MTHTAEAPSFLTIMYESDPCAPPMPIPQHHAPIQMGQAHSSHPNDVHSYTYDQNTPSYSEVPPHPQYSTYASGGFVVPPKPLRYSTVPNTVPLYSNSIVNSEPAPAAAPQGFFIRSPHSSGATADTPPIFTSADRSETMGGQYAPQPPLSGNPPFEYTAPSRRPHRSSPQHKDPRYLYEPYPPPLTPPTNHSRPYERHPHPYAQSTQHHSHYDRGHPSHTIPHPQRTQASTSHGPHTQTTPSLPPQTLPRSIAHSISEPTSTPSRQSSVYVSGVPVHFDDEVGPTNSARWFPEAQSDHTAAWYNSQRPGRTGAGGSSTLPLSVYSSGSPSGQWPGSGMQTIIEDGIRTEEPGEYHDGSNLPADRVFPKEGTKKALLIGVTYKEQSSVEKLRGCIHDVCLIGQFLIDQGYLPENICTLTDDIDDRTRWPTKANILSHIDWLVAGAQAGDSLFFHFSGHGTQIDDEDGDEPEGKDDTLLPLDHDVNGAISDDELNRRLVKPLPKGCRLTALVDACHSGTALDLPFQYYHNEECTTLVEFIDRNNVTNKGTEADVVSFSACKDNQVCEDIEDNNMDVGAMTLAFVKAFKDGQSYRQFVNRIGQLMNEDHRMQKPQLGTSHKINLNGKFVF